jgi:hypothetical protein
MSYDFVSGSFGDVITGHHSRVMKSKTPLSANDNVDPTILDMKPSAGWFLSIEESIDTYLALGA